MITRAYQNAIGERQEVSLSADQWEAMTEDGLNEILGFCSAEPEPTSALKDEPKVSPKPRTRKKK